MEQVRRSGQLHIQCWLYLTTHILDMSLRFMKKCTVRLSLGTLAFANIYYQNQCVFVAVQEGLAHGRWSRRRMQKLVVPQGFWYPGMQPECPEYCIFHDIFICSGSAHSVHQGFLPGSHLAKEGSAPAQSTPRPMADGLWRLLIACFCGTLPCQGEFWRCGEDGGWQLFAIYPVGASAAHFPGTSVGLDALFTEWSSCWDFNLQPCRPFGIISCPPWVPSC